jgi:cysteine synthase A
MKTEMNEVTIFSALGKTPLLHVDGIYAKFEVYNPTGSVKDRMASFIVGKAERGGILKKGQRIIEVTSGNTGIALAMISSVRGYHFTAIMPESMSIARRQMMQRFGAEIILTPAVEDVGGAVKKWHELMENDPNAWSPRQFENPDNVEAHRLGIGMEIADAIQSADAFVAGVGTGGTLVGVAKALKEKNPNVKIFAVEPDESAVLSGDNPGLHKIQGIGEGFIPWIVQTNMNIIDDVIRVKSDDAITASLELSTKYGILVGISSGANFIAAQRISEKYKTVISLFPDRGERYL